MVRRSQKDCLIRFVSAISVQLAHKCCSLKPFNPTLLHCREFENKEFTVAVYLSRGLPFEHIIGPRNSKRKVVGHQIVWS